MKMVGFCKVALIISLGVTGASVEALTGGSFSRNVMAAKAMHKKAQGDHVPAPGQRGMVDRQPHQRASDQAGGIPGVQNAKPTHAIFGIKRAGQRVDHRFHQAPSQALHRHADQQAGIGRQAQIAGPRHDRKPGRHQGGGANERAAETDFRQYRTDQQQGDGKARESRSQHGCQPLARRQRAERIEIFRLDVHGGCCAHADGRTRV
jgi:hypothetical protein